MTCRHFPSLSCHFTITIGQSYQPFPPSSQLLSTQFECSPHENWFHKNCMQNWMTLALLLFRSALNWKRMRCTVWFVDETWKHSSKFPVHFVAMSKGKVHKISPRNLCIFRLIKPGFIGRKHSVIAVSGTADNRLRQKQQHQQQSRFCRYWRAWRAALKALEAALSSGDEDGNDSGSSSSSSEKLSAKAPARSKASPKHVWGLYSQQSTNKLFESVQIDSTRTLWSLRFDYSQSVHKCS